MSVTNLSFSGSYLEYLPLNTIAKHPGGPPKDGVAFCGYPQQHPTEKSKLILVYDPLGKNPTILEFKVDDILYVEDIPQAVTEQGEGIPLVKLWIRRGAHGMILEPFEVEEFDLFMDLRRKQKDHFAKKRSTVQGATAQGADGNGSEGFPSANFRL